MRLSEAIRLGAMTGPQLFGKENDNNGGTCARGAAAAAIGKRTWYECNEFLRFAYDTRLRCPHPRCYDDKREYNLASVIAYHLNDMHHWTREQIADWVELHEPLPEHCEADQIETV